MGSTTGLATATSSLSALRTANFSTGKSYSASVVANYVSVILAKIDAADRYEATQKVTRLLTNPVGRE